MARPDLLEELDNPRREAGIDAGGFLGEHRLRQHHTARAGGALRRQYRDRGAAARLYALERDGDGGEGQSHDQIREYGFQSK